MNTTLKTIAASLAVISMAASITACSKDDKKPATQVAAKVNSQEISVHQINYVLSRSGANAQTPEQTNALRKAALERLIDQQVLVEEATEKKIDRQPDVVMAIELAKREVIARALLEQMAAAAPKPSEDEAKAYYKANPALFSERRVFSVQELIVPVAAGAGTQIKDMVAANKTIEDIAGYLKSRNIQFGGGAAQRTAEQIPLEILPRIHALKDGQSTVIETPQAITIVRVVQSQSQPVTEAQAVPRIVQFLANQRNQEAANKELKRLKEKAKITYEGDFASNAAAAPAATLPDASKASAAPAANDSGIEKGLKGLN
jgi:EpsD family peptidyl-prolyl cis-trans isomerase